MKRTSKQFVLSLLVFTLAIQVSHAQYAKGFCPMGDEVKLDTLFYSSKTTMPFDQCFYLKTSVKGNAKILYFTIVPINKHGEIDHTTRDLNIFFKSGWTKPKREDYPNKDKYQDARDEYKKNKDKFKGNLTFWKRKRLARLHTDIVTNYSKKNNRTNLVLKIPPLDPHREYKIEFWQRDNASLKKLVDIGELIFRSHKEADVNTKNKILLQAERQYLNHPISALDLKSIGIRDFEDYRNYNSLIDFSFNRDFRYNNIYEYRLLFKQLVANQSFTATDLTTAVGPPGLPHAKHKPSKRDPEKAKIIFPAIDTAGDSLVVGTDYQLQVEIASIGDTILRNEKPIPHPNTISYNPLGLLQLSENGTHALFKPNLLVSETMNNSANYRFFKFYREIEKSQGNLNATLRIHDDYNCFGLAKISSCCSKTVLGSLDAKLDELQVTLSNARRNVSNGIVVLTKEKNTLETRVQNLKDEISERKPYSFSSSLKKLKEHYSKEKPLQDQLVKKRLDLRSLKSELVSEKLRLLNEIDSLQNQVFKNQSEIIKYENDIIRTESSKLLDKRQFTDVLSDLALARESLNQTKNLLSYQQSIKRKLPRLDHLQNVKNVLEYLNGNCDEISKEGIVSAYNPNKDILEDVILGNVIGYLKLLNDARDAGIQKLILCLTKVQQNFKKVRTTKNAINYLGGIDFVCPECSNDKTKEDIIKFLQEYLSKSSSFISELNDGKRLISDWSLQAESVASNAKKNFVILDQWITYLNITKERYSDNDDKISSIVSCFKNLRNRFEWLMLQRNRSEDLTKLFDKASQCTCGDDNCKCAGVTQDLSKETTLRTTLWVLNNEDQLDKKLEEGLISFKDIYTEVKKDQHANRIANLTTNLQYVKELIGFAQKSGISTGRDYSTLLKNLKGQIKRMAVVKKELTAIVSSEEKLLDSYFETFRSYGFAFKKTSTNNSTSNMDLKARSQFRIVPDFGFVAIGSNINSSLKVTDFVPYLGFHINFRPINKKIPLRMIRYKNWKHRTSIMFGLTTTSIAIDDKRQDLFGSTNKSLLTALGFRVNNYFRVNAGAVWFRSFDTNPLRGNRPLSASPFVGVSLDLEIKDLFGGISSLVK